MNAKCKDTSRCSVNQEIAELLVLAKFELYFNVSQLNSIGWALSWHFGKRSDLEKQKQKTRASAQQTL